MHVTFVYVSFFSRFFFAAMTRGGRQVMERRRAWMKVDYLNGNRPYTAGVNPVYDLTKWVKEIEDFAKQTVASRSDIGVTEEQALRVIKSFLLMTNKATRMGNVPLFIRDSIETIERVERVKTKIALTAAQSTGGLEVPKFDPPVPTERPADHEQTLRSVGSFVERRAAEPSKSHLYHPYQHKPICHAPSSLQKPETFGQLQRPFEPFAEQQRDAEPLKTCNGHEQQSEEPSLLVRLEASEQTQRSEPSQSKQEPQTIRQSRASVIVTATMDESTPLTNSQFVPLIPKVERT